MKILSFDQSTRLSAYAVFEDGKLIDYNFIKLKTKDTDKRFVEMVQGIVKVIADVVPDVVVFENVSLQTNAATLTSLARLLGAVTGWCIFGNIEHELYYASQWRRILGFKNGRGCNREYYKERAINYIKDLFGIDEGDVVAEAICIGLAYIKDKVNKDNEETGK